MHPILCAGENPAATLSRGWASKGFTAEQRQHWAFQPVRRREPAPGPSAAWARSPIDHFIAEKLAVRNLRPAPEADRPGLLRRVTIDLTGILPTPGEVSAYVADTSPDAYEKVVDRLLRSPRFGERWARHWLDLARYADSNGYGGEARANAWRYRDYVIRSFNEDKPYDRFVREQVAGDELWPDDPNAFIATGFLRGYPDEHNARNLALRRQEILNDITDTTSAAFLGLTAGCARCHDHKFDPIRQEDYYRLQAFFANTLAKDDRPMLTGSELARYQRRLTAWEKATETIRTAQVAILAPVRQAIFDKRLTGFTPDSRVAITKPDAERTPLEKWMYGRSLWLLNTFDKRAVKRLKGKEKERYEELEAELAKFGHLHPGPLPVATGMTDVNPIAPPTHILAQGAYDKPLKEVQPGFPAILDSSEPAIVAPPESPTTGRRSALAHWIASPKNPLTARVLVNRIWAHHFGKGLVATPSDFGKMGRRPTHPELLDWLADELVRGGWHMKAIHRLIVTSSVYRQSSDAAPEAIEADPANTLLSRFPRQRLEAEALRDSLLGAAGLLDETKGGPAVYPPLPPGVQSDIGPDAWKDSRNPADAHRRSIYTFVNRDYGYPLLEVFDAPGSQEPCSRRSVTTVPTQALALLNSEVVLGWSRGLAARLLRERPGSVDSQIDWLYRILYSRPPDAWEKDASLTFLQRDQAILAGRLAAGEALAVPKGFDLFESNGLPADANRLQLAALVDLCHLMANSNEMAYRF